MAKTRVRRRDRAGRTWMRGAALVGAATLAVSACGSSASPSSSGAGSGNNTGNGAPAATSAVDTLTIANAVKIDTLDPAQNSLNESIWLDQNIYSRLYQPNASGTALIPDLATGYTVSPNKLVYTFHLRSAKFSNGMPVTAQDFVFSIKRADAVSGGWGFLLTAMKSVTAPNPSTLVITLSQPHAPLIADLAMYAYSVLPQSLVTKEGNAFFSHPVGSGPFMVSSLDPNTQLVLSRNPNYYGPKPKISHVTVQIVPNANTRVLLLESGKVDVIENPPGNLIKEIDATGKATVDEFPSTQVNFVQLDEHFAPFKKLAVRQALNYAIDRQAIDAIAYQGHAIPGSSFMPYKMEYWDSSLRPYPYDPAKAKQLLAQAGYPHGFNCFMIVTSGDTTGQAAAVLMKSELAAVGINMSIQSYEQTTAYAKEDGGHSEMGERYWTNDIIDPDEVATFGADSTGGANAFNSYWADPQVNTWVEQARATLDPSARQALYDKVQQAVYTQTPYLVYNYSPFLYGVGNWVRGFHVSPVGSYDLSLETLTVGKH